MEHNQPDQENWIIEGISAILQKKMAGDVKFFGNGASPSITSGNQLTYIATGYQSLKGRSDKYNAYLFLSYLQEKYSADGTGWDIIQEIAQSDSIGIKAVSDALVTLGIDTDVKDIDRKSTRLNSSHALISYAVFCLKKKKTDIKLINKH